MENQETPRANDPPEAPDVGHGNQGGFKDFGSDNYPGYFRGEWSGGGFKEIDATNMPEGLLADPPNQNKESSDGNAN